MATFVKPENVLKRAEELVKVGQNQAALQAPALAIPSPFSASPVLLPATPFSQSQKLQLGLDNCEPWLCVDESSVAVLQLSVGDTGEGIWKCRSAINYQRISLSQPCIPTDSSAPGCYCGCVCDTSCLIHTTIKLSAGSPPADNGSTPLNVISPPPFLSLVAAADASATPVASFNPSAGSSQDVIFPTSLNPLSPAAMDVTMTPVASFILPSNPSVGFPSGHAVNGASVMKSIQRPLLPKSAEHNKVSAPPAQCSSGNRRKSSRSAPKAPAPKRSCARPTKVSSVKGGKRSTSQATEIRKAKEWPQNKRSTSQLCCVVGHPKLAVSKGSMGEPERTPDVLVSLVSNSVLLRGNVGDVADVPFDALLR